MLKIDISKKGENTRNVMIKAGAGVMDVVIDTCIVLENLKSCFSEDSCEIDELVFTAACIAVLSGKTTKEAVTMVMDAIKDDEDGDSE